MDLQAIANAIATNYANVTATNGSQTETLSATADLPNQVFKSALLVYPPVTADLSIDLGPHLDDHYFFTVRLLRDPNDVPARTRWLYAWATAMRTKVQARLQLGLPGVVDWAEVRTMRVQIDGQTYSFPGGTLGTFDVVEMTVDVKVYELTTIGI